MAKRDVAQRNAETARRLQERISRQLKAGAGKGVEAGIRFLAARMKETVSVPAPKKAIRGAALPGKRLGPIVGYRATAPAVRGAPPRVVSGNLRRNITHKMLTPYVGLVGVKARSLPSKKRPEGFDYPRFLELGPEDQWGGGDHQFIKPTVEKYRRELKVLVGKEVRFELRKQ